MIVSSHIFLMLQLKFFFYAAIILFYYCNTVVRTKKGLCHDSISVELGKQLIEVTLFLLEKPENPKLENPLRLSLFRGLRICQVL